MASVNDETLFPEKPSLIRITDVVADEGKGKRKPGRPSKNKNVVRINTKGVDYSDIVIPLGIALDFVFSIPVSLGWGRHWELSADETTDLTTCVRDVLEAFPSETTAQFIRALEKYIPLLSLGITAWGIIKPRLETTQRLLTEKKRIAALENQQTEAGRVTNIRSDARQSASG